MSTTRPRILQRIAFERSAQAYLRNLPMEHFMEATGQATQRAITLASFALVRARWRTVHIFNELLIQYRFGRRQVLRQVVPDNMVVLCDQSPTADTSFNVPLEPAGPFWVMEYVSKSNPRKDYEDSFDKYERELKVPYYLIFHPDEQEFTLYRRGPRKYVSVKPNEHGRYAVPELEMEIALVDGWVRFWFQGELLPLPADLQHNLDETRRQLTEARREAHRARRRAEEQSRRADEEHQARLAAEQEIARLRALLGQKPGRGEEPS
jgi:Uma2 family endonuclease